MYKHLEFAKTRHGRAVVYFRRGKGARIRLPSDISSPEFTRRYFAALNGSALPHIEKMPPTKATRQKQLTEATLKEALSGALARSRRKAREFDLTLDWALRTAELQNFRCALTGIPFHAAHKSPGVKNPYTPSLDRIDPKGGYTQSNVRIVVFAINAMLLDWGRDVFEAVTRAYRHTQNGTNIEHSIPSPLETRPSPPKNIRRVNWLAQ